MTTRKLTKLQVVNKRIKNCEQHITDMKAMLYEKLMPETECKKLKKAVPDDYIKFTVTYNRKVRDGYAPKNLIEKIKYLAPKWRNALSKRLAQRDEILKSRREKAMRKSFIDFCNGDYTDDRNRRVIYDRVAFTCSPTRRLFDFYKPRCSDEIEFYCQLWLNPEDHTTILVYCDWLDEEPTMKLRTESVNTACKTNGELADVLRKDLASYIKGFPN